jgi:hypothetical protein
MLTGLEGVKHGSKQMLVGLGGTKYGIQVGFGMHLIKTNIEL